MDDATKRQERFSKSREFAKELVADSIITDAAAQFIALMIEEIHRTKIEPLQSELACRAELPPAPAQIIVAEQRGFVKGLEAAVEKIKSMKATEGVLCQRTLNLVASGLSISATKAIAAIKEPKP